MYLVFSSSNISPGFKLFTKSSSSLPFKVLENFMSLWSNILNSSLTGFKEFASKSLFVFIFPKWDISIILAFLLNR